MAFRNIVRAIRRVGRVTAGALNVVPFAGGAIAGPMVTILDENEVS